MNIYSCIYIYTHKRKEYSLHMNMYFIYNSMGMCDFADFRECMQVEEVYMMKDKATGVCVCVCCVFVCVCV